MKKECWYNLSATTLHLLRTLNREHTKNNPVGEVLIPAEGHCWNHKQEDEIIHFTTVFLGDNCWVTHKDDLIEIELESGEIVFVPKQTYQSEIKKMVLAVENLFNKSEPRLPIDDLYEREANYKFWREWKKIRGEFYPSLSPLSKTLNNYAQSTVL